MFNENEDSYYLLSLSMIHYILYLGPILSWCQKKHLSSYQSYPVRRTHSTASLSKYIIANETNIQRVLQQCLRLGVS